MAQTHPEQSTSILNCLRREIFINGEWRPPDEDEEPISVSNSADSSELGEIMPASPNDVDAAVRAAQIAGSDWRHSSPSERAAALRALAVGLEAMEPSLSQTISLEVGTPINLSQRLQVGLPITVLNSYADAVETFDWEWVVGNSTVHREPAGVVGAITPWNYPLYQMVVKVGAAFAAGCSVVAKPSSVAPFSVFAFADAVLDVGLPPGLFNLVPGSSNVGQAIAAHPGVDVLSFTGSTDVGRQVAAAAAQNVTKVTLELGGKSACLILEDADLERAVTTGVRNAFLNSGQTCTAWTRMIVPAALQSDVVDIARGAAAELPLGHPLEARTRLGPLATESQRTRVLRYIEIGVRGEGTLVLGGSAPPEKLDAGFYVAPTIFADVRNDSTIAQEEIFGPVLTIIPYSTEEEATTLANDSPYGLTAAIWTANEARASRIARLLQVGQVDINGARFNPHAPFGGYKLSGIGRELGSFGIDEFCQLKAVQR